MFFNSSILSFSMLIGCIFLSLRKIRFFFMKHIFVGFLYPSSMIKEYLKDNSDRHPMLGNCLNLVDVEEDNDDIIDSDVEDENDDNIDED